MLPSPSIGHAIRLRQSFGVTSAFFVGELLGVVCILAGFLVSVEVFSTYRIPLVGTVVRSRTPSDEGA